MFEDEAKKTWHHSKILWKEATRYDKIVVCIIVIGFWLLGIFFDAITHVGYDAIVAWNQPAEAEEGELNEADESLPTVIPATATPSPKPTAAPTPTLAPTEENLFFSKKISPRMTFFGEQNGDWRYYVDENTGVIYIVYNPMNARYGITVAYNADGSLMTRDQLNNTEN